MFVNFTNIDALDGYFDAWFFTNSTTVGLYHPAARTAGLLQSLLMSFIGIYAP